MNLIARTAGPDGHPDVGALLSAVPYCVHLGIKARIEDGRVVLDLPFADHLIGNPIIPAIHGGVTGSLLETAAIVQVIWEIKMTAMPKPVDITVDYLRTGRAITSHASARIARQGRRVVNVHAEMWQDESERPIAALRGHFLIGA